MIREIHSNTGRVNVQGWQVHGRQRRCNGSRTVTGFTGEMKLMINKQPSTMPAVVLQAPGGPEVLHHQEFPLPALTRDTDVLIRLKAAGLNPVDAKLRQNPASYTMSLPVVLGFDGAGVVETVGKAVTRFTPGDEVYFCHPSFGGRSGCYAAYTVVPEILLARKPAGLNFTEAAAIPLALITAWESLFARASVQARQRFRYMAVPAVWVTLPSSSQNAPGASVCTTVSSETKASIVETLGADEHIFYRDEDFAHAVLRWSDGQGVDVALDTVGGQTFEHTFAAERTAASRSPCCNPRPPPTGASPASAIWASAWN